jgi:hypothetical protein
MAHHRLSGGTVAVSPPGCTCQKCSSPSSNRKDLSCWLGSSTRWGPVGLGWAVLLLLLLLLSSLSLPLSSARSPSRAVCQSSPPPALSASSASFPSPSGLACLVCFPFFPGLFVLERLSIRFLNTVNHRRGLQFLIRFIIAFFSPIKPLLLLLLRCQASPYNFFSARWNFEF